MLSFQQMQGRNSDGRPLERKFFGAEIYRMLTNCFEILHNMSLCDSIDVYSLEVVWHITMLVVRLKGT